MDKMDYGRVARCHQYNEELIAEVYKKAAEKVEYGCLEAAFLFIAHDSEKHAKIFAELAKVYGAEEFDPEDCSQYSAMSYGLRGHLLNVLEEIEKARDEKDILEIMEKLEDIEVSITQIDRSVLVDGIEDEKDRELVRRILKYVEEDEARHEKVIDELIKAFK